MTEKDFVQLNLERYLLAQETHQEEEKKQDDTLIERRKIIDDAISDERWFKKQKLNVLRSMAKEVPGLPDSKIQLPRKKLLPILLSAQKKLNLRRNSTMVQDVCMREMEIEAMYDKWYNKWHNFTINCFTKLLHSVKLLWVTNS